MKEIEAVKMMPSTTNGADQQQIHHQQQQQQIQGSSDENRTIWIGDLQQWMDEGYINTCFAHTGEVNSVKVIRSKQTGQSEGYGFIEFLSYAAAEKVLQSFNGTTMPNTEQTFRLNWATFSAGAAPPARVGRKQRKLKGPEAAARIPTVTHLLIQQQQIQAQQYSDYYAFRGHEVYQTPFKEGKKRGLRSLIRSRLAIGSPLIHLDRGLRSIEVSQGIDGLVDMKPSYGTTVVRKLEDAGNIPIN
ncbi:unnamed protein product [Camellia sinensis]